MLVITVVYFYMSSVILYEFTPLLWSGLVFVSIHKDQRVVLSIVCIMRIFIFSRTQSLAIIT